MIKSEETIAIEFERRMRDLASDLASEAVLLQMNPRVSAEFTGSDARVLSQIEQDTGKVFVFEGSEGLPLEHFSVLLEGSREEIIERAVPFRAGEEVYVDIVEPHMFSPGDAVAKIDGYIIQVVGGERLVGEKRLVSIVEAGRTAARATLVGEDGAAAGTVDGKPKTTRARRTRAAAAKPKRETPEPAAPEPEAEALPTEDRTDPDGPTDAARSAAPPAEEDSEDGLDSKPRRRGRRGGRRRSGAKAESASTTAGE